MWTAKEIVVDLLCFGMKACLSRCNQQTSVVLMCILVKLEVDTACRHVHSFAGSKRAFRPTLASCG